MAPVDRRLAVRWNTSLTANKTREKRTVPNIANAPLLSWVVSNWNSVQNYFWEVSLTKSNDNDGGVCEAGSKYGSGGGSDMKMYWEWRK